MVWATIPGRINDGIEEFLDPTEEQERIIAVWKSEYAALEAECNALQARIDKALTLLRDAPPADGNAIILGDAI